ncbi:DUF3710 domain-containing protein [Antrihabitans cavernicola]|uniref:DUF3710 domain-containing protein n=1 Tax=Antrihabitans cavernicola TaxID=2495913 RepID=A0A5A7SFJ0_9NOCA|nr:DUF3710 domain-containing protein [Spelaeibacter cavernicola]KAA0023403.1 DUF3710 domain-containing protein [Spelaeibacter cavernicola]
MFGKRKKATDSEPETFFADEPRGYHRAPDDDAADDFDDVADEYAPTASDEDRGPYDANDVEEDSFEGERLDLGSVIVPVPAGGQLQVEMGPDGAPQAVHLMLTDVGRITVAAYAAPKSAGQWRDVTTDLADSLRKDNGSVSIENGPWGRELVASAEGADMRFIGVDGYRWMVRLVAVGPKGAAEEGLPLVEAAREILRETVVRRGDDPHPVRTPLPVVLPQVLAEQLMAAHQQQLAQQAAAELEPALPQPSEPEPQQPKRPRRGAGGSAMQQLGRQ